jgi:hypothetical protein
MAQSREFTQTVIRATVRNIRQELERLGDLSREVLVSDGETAVWEEVGGHLDEVTNQFDSFVGHLGDVGIEAEPDDEPER